MDLRCWQGDDVDMGGTKPHSSAHLNEEDGPHFAPGLGLSQGVVAGQVAALHCQGVMHHAKGEDTSQERDGLG